MKYVVIDESAVDELVANRFLQSVEFEPGHTLLSLMLGEVKQVRIAASIQVNHLDDGVFLTGPILKLDSKFLVIDEEQAGLFRDQKPSDALFSFQKLLRFAKKLWQGLSLTFAERMISGSSKAVLFPYRYRPVPYRVVVEREPLAGRLGKRGQAGNWLLAYKAGYDAGDAVKEQAGLTNFRKAVDSAPEIRKILSEEGKRSSNLIEEPACNQMEVAQLEGGQSFATTSLYRRFEDWLPLLTEQQTRFVVAPIHKPMRIEGAAGTGKTLALILKAIYVLRVAKKQGEDCHLVFVTHSDATKRTIEEVASVIDGDGFAMSDRRLAQQSLNICTLSELCADVLRQAISESEFIDRDAMESKELQLLYISEALDNVMRDDFPGHSKFLSEEIQDFLQTEDRWRIVTMLQHEISVIIKGRASEDLEKYKKIPPLKYGIPISGNSDKGFIFTIFREYSEYLRNAGQFDTDDVVLTTIGQLDTPIWRRRRLRDGYDAVFVDETHLFNINELHLFHYFTKVEGPYPIAYSIDRSQAVGDKGWDTQEIASTLADDVEPLSSDGGEVVQTVFRSSPEIVNLAFSILSSGATLFTNFDNPMEAASSGFTEAEERLCADPAYFNVPSEEALIEQAFERAEALQKELNCRRNDILIVSLSPQIVTELSTYAQQRNKPLLLLKKRGDATAVEAARDSAQWVVGHADFVGGLEFQAVVIVGVDTGRVPPSNDHENFSSKSFLSYVSHNRLYVAVSRARYRVEMLGEKARGPSRIISAAISSGLVREHDLS